MDELRVKCLELELGSINELNKSLKEYKMAFCRENPDMLKAIEALSAKLSERKAELDSEYKAHFDLACEEAELIAEAYSYL